MSSKRKKRKLGSYPSFSVIGSMLLALFVLGLFGLFLSISNRLTEIIRDNMEVQVYLMKDLSDSERIQIEKTLAGSPYALKKDGSPLVNYVSKEEASRKFIEESGEDFYELLGDNPLRDSYIIKLDYAYQDADKLVEMKNEVEAISGVFELDYVESVYSKIISNITTIGLILMGFAVILFIAVVLLINNTIKLALFSQRFLIRSMQLVGAKSTFIQQPFLFRSMLHGVIAGIIASVSLYFLLNFSQNRFPQLGEVIDMPSLLLIFGGTVVVGALVGFSGTYLAIRKYLKMSPGRIILSICQKKKTCHLVEKITD